jgi:hypothetical protein
MSAACNARRCCVLTTLLFVCVSLAADTSKQSMAVGGATLEITLPVGESAEFQANLVQWVHRAADAVTTYYGHFPVKHLTLRISADDREGVHHGVTYPEGGGLIVISVGRQTSKQYLESDWMLTHEMIHLAFPDMPRRHHWIEEGLSVYVEPVARVQAGQLSVEEMWFETVRDMHQGEPDTGDEGLDRTHTWGRTYWGGAMFCLMADVRIRQQTKNTRGLQDALRAILNAGGTITEDWEIEKAFAVGDKATGTTVLQDLYREMSDKPDPVDLAVLWKKLGVSVEGKTAKFDSKAPDAAIREAITRTPSTK